MSDAQPSRSLLYLDTSALLTLYLERDTRTAVVQAAREGALGLVVNALSLTEARSALAQRRQRGDITAPHYSRARKALLEQWSTFARFPLTPTVLERAGDLAEKHPSLRTLDALHLATVLELNAVGTVRFFTFDVAQRNIARLELLTPA